jgi:hypothetical protein
MNSKHRLTVENLIQGELDGKATAIAGYDEMLWKIRTGYAVFLYGAIGIIAALVQKKILDLGHTTGCAIGVLILGFSAFAALLDFCFMTSKLRVVNYRDRLVELAYAKAQGGDMGAKADADLVECLKNSGERRERIDWSRRTGFWVPLILYGGTCVACVAAAWMLAK